MEFICQTRGDTPPKGKRYIYIHAAKGDENSRNTFVKMILAFQEGLNYAVWYSNDPESLTVGNNVDELQPMNVFMLLVTDTTLDWAGKAARPLLDDLANLGIAVLPVFKTPGVIPRFNQIFGNLHGVLMTTHDATSQLETQLALYLISDALSGKIIQDAFTAQLFMSYRKKDRKEALRIMKAMHDTPWADSVAIWYDEFLHSGQNFNQEIQAALEESAAMVLAVTPNLLEEGNYVSSVEYPKAIKAKKRVIPFEAVSTDPAALKSAFEGLPDSISIDQKGSVAIVLKPFIREPEAKRREPYLSYLLGMAFLMGLRVEKDVERARALLEEAAGQNVLEAAQQLRFMYIAGIGLDRDLDMALEWGKKAFEMAITKATDDISIKRIYEFLYGNDGLDLLLKARDHVEEANETSNRFIAMLSEHGLSLDERERTMWISEAYLSIADLHFDVLPEPERIRQAQEACEKAFLIFQLSHALSKEDHACLYVKAYYRLSDIEKAKGNIDAAESNITRALNWQEDFVKDNPSLENRKILASVNMSLGNLLRYRMNPKAYTYLNRAVELWEQVLKEMPSVSNREGMAMAYYNFAPMHTTGDLRKAMDCLQKAGEIIRKLKSDFPRGSFVPSIEDISIMRRKIKVSRVIGKLFLPALIIAIGIVIWILFRR